MEFMDVIRVRSSVRAYSGQDVESSKIERLLECARLAPSWANQQCWSFIVVRDSDKVAALTKAAGPSNSWMREAPVVIVACGDSERSGKRSGIEYFTVDVAIAMEHLVLAAADLGLGTCWIGYFNEASVKDLLGIPENIRVVALTPVGYPAAEPASKKKNRRSLDEIVHLGSWQGK
jgi:nitroreductase